MKNKNIRQKYAKNLNYDNLAEFFLQKCNVSIHISQKK